MEKEPIQLRAEKIARQNKNLHGEKGVDGLTGRWRGTWYDRGIPRKALLSPMEMYRSRKLNLSS